MYFLSTFALLFRWDDEIHRTVQLYGGFCQNAINQRLGFFLHARKQLLALGAGVAGDLKLGIDLIDVLLDGALR